MSGTKTAQFQGIVRVPVSAAPYTVATGTAATHTINGYGELPVLNEGSQLAETGAGSVSAAAQQISLIGFRLNTLGFDTFNVTGQKSPGTAQHAGPMLTQGGNVLWSAGYAANNPSSFFDSFVGLGSLYAPSGITRQETLGYGFFDNAQTDQAILGSWGDYGGSQFLHSAVVGGIKGASMVVRNGTGFRMIPFWPGYSTLYHLLPPTIGADNRIVTLPDTTIQDFATPLQTYDGPANQNYLWLPNTTTKTISLLRWNIGLWNPLTGLFGPVSTDLPVTFQFDNATLNAYIAANLAAYMLAPCAGRGWLFLTATDDYYINADGSKYWQLKYDPVGGVSIQYGFAGVIQKAIDRNGVFWYVGPGAQSGANNTPLNSYQFNIAWNPVLYPLQLQPFTLKCFNPCAEFEKGIVK